MSSELTAARQDAPRGPALTAQVKARERRRRREAARRRVLRTCEKAGLDPSDLLGSPTSPEPATS